LELGLEWTLINLKELIYVGVGFLTLISLLIAGLIWLMRAKFVMQSDCEMDQKECHSQVCRKIDKLQQTIERNSIVERQTRDNLYQRNVWIQQTITKLEDAVNSIYRILDSQDRIRIDNMPKKI